MRGSVVNAAGEPVASALVQLSDFGGSLLGSQITDGAGEFSFMVSSPGPYEAYILTPTGAEQVSLPQGQFQGIVLRLRSGPDPGRADRAGATVSLNDLEAPRKAKSEIAKAEKEMDKSNLATAWTLVNDALRKAPNWGKAYLLRGVLSFTFHNYDSARSDFTNAIAHDPEDSMALTLLGKLYSTTGNLGLSRTYLQRALQLPPVTWPTYLEMSELDLKEHNWADASRMTALAMRCQPGPPPAIHYLSGLAAFGMHNYAQAGKEFSRYLAQAPQTAKTARTRAAAQHELQALARLQPTHPH
ncbi:MAG: hypothetical protein ACRD1C_05990 [Terriglobales bacterium]